MRGPRLHMLKNHGFPDAKRCRGRAPSLPGRADAGCAALQGVARVGDFELLSPSGSDCGRVGDFEAAANCIGNTEASIVAAPKREFIPNQIFIGLPWKNVRSKYEHILPKIEKKFPLHFTIVGRNDGQGAEDLLEIIKQRIASSSYAVFDATGGNANVSLEYGYAEGLEVPRAIFLNAHKATQKNTAGSPIISDLTGKRRVQYKSERTLSAELQQLCREHDYTRRFDKAVTKILKKKSRGAKKSGRALALRIVRSLDGKAHMRRAELVQHLQAQGYREAEVDVMLKKLHAGGLIKCTVGKSSQAYVA